MIETHTSWEDTGFDCDHCGGRILKRTDHESGQRDRTCYQCEKCSCQWTLAHEPLRVGTLSSCRKAQRERVAVSETTDPYARWVLIGLGILVTLFLLRFGGGFAVRYLFPLIVAAAGIYILIRFGRVRDWW